MTLDDRMRGAFERRLEATRETTRSRSNLPGDAAQGEAAPTVVPTPDPSGASTPATRRRPMATSAWVVATAALIVVVAGVVGMATLTNETQPPLVLDMAPATAADEGGGPIGDAHNPGGPGVAGDDRIEVATDPTPTPTPRPTPLPTTTPMPTPTPTAVPTVGAQPQAATDPGAGRSDDDDTDAPASATVQAESSDTEATGTEATGTEGDDGAAGGDRSAQPSGQHSGTGVGSPQVTSTPEPTPNPTPTPTGTPVPTATVMPSPTPTPEPTPTPNPFAAGVPNGVCPSGLRAELELATLAYVGENTGWNRLQNLVDEQDGPHYYLAWEPGYPHQVTVDVTLAEPVLATEIRVAQDPFTPVEGSISIEIEGVWRAIALSGTGDWKRQPFAEPIELASFRIRRSVSTANIMEVLVCVADPGT